MKTKIHVERPDDIEFTLTMTMTLAQWREIIDETPKNASSKQMREAIERMIGKAESEFAVEDQP